MSVKDKPEELANLCFALESIRSKEGIIGYIQRNSKSASVDLSDSTKIIDYAILSTESLETGEVAAEIFDVGSISSVIIEGNDVKVLSLVIGDQRLSIFMSKEVDHNRILKELDLTRHAQKRNERFNQDNEKNHENKEIESPL